MRTTEASLPPPGIVRRWVERVRLIRHAALWVRSAVRLQKTRSAVAELEGRVALLESRSAEASHVTIPTLRAEFGTLAASAAALDGRVAALNAATLAIPALRTEFNILAESAAALDGRVEALNAAALAIPALRTELDALAASLTARIAATEAVAGGAAALASRVDGGAPAGERNQGPRPLWAARDDLERLENEFHQLWARLDLLRAMAESDAAGVPSTAEDAARVVAAEHRILDRVHRTAAATVACAPAFVRILPDGHAAPVLVLGGEAKAWLDALADRGVATLDLPPPVGFAGATLPWLGIADVFTALESLPPGSLRGAVILGATEVVGLRDLIRLAELLRDRVVPGGTVAFDALDPQAPLSRAMRAVAPPAGPVAIEPCLLEMLLEEARFGQPTLLRLCSADTATASPDAGSRYMVAARAWT